MHAAWADLAAEMAEMPDIGQAIICMGGGDWRAGGHVIDAITGGDGSDVQDTATPACMPIAACLLFMHRARLRPQKLHFLRVCHSPKIYYHGLRLFSQPYMSVPRTYRPLARLVSHI